MGILQGKTCYLSGAIEHDDTGLNWRTKPKCILSERFDVQLYDPFDDPKQQWVPLLKEAQENKDFVAMRRIAKNFVRKDLEMVVRVDFLVAYLPFRVPTTGTHHEIITAVNAKKPTLLVCPQGKQYVPLWYYGFIPHEAMFSSWDELYDYLREVDEGKHAENRRWHFVYGLV